VAEILIDRLEKFFLFYLVMILLRVANGTCVH
jgi:hypothetical protein